MRKESQRLEEKIKRLKNIIEKLPAGKLISGENGKYQQWFRSDGYVRIYISKKKQKELIEKLAIKKYLSYQLEDCENERRAIEFYLKHHREDVGKAEKFLTEKTEYEELLAPYFKTKSKELQEWLQEPFEQNPQYNDNLILKTISGNQVRSKSEVIIDTLLYINKIPFRYECALNGIIPTINLIMTFETSENPLGAEDVMELIEKYFEVEASEGVMQIQFGEL